MKDDMKRRARKGRKRSCPGYFSVSTLEFGRDIEDESTEEEEEEESKTQTLEKIRKWSNAHLKLVQINVDSDDDECFLCKYKMDQ